MSGYGDEKVEYTQENSNTLFRALETDPSDHTSGRIARRYANSEGVLDASSLQKLLKDYRNVLVKARPQQITHAHSVVPPNESTEQTKARLEVFFFYQ
jgi:hypothetical protein